MVDGNLTKPERKQQKNKKKMPSSIKEIENTTYESVRGTPFTKIHGRPSRHDYEILKKEASDLACELDDITYNWSRSATGDEYGLLAEIIGEDEYDHLTNLTWIQETEPSNYDPAITDATATHTRKRMEQEWQRTRETWSIRKGFLRGVAANMRDALDENWYSQLKHIHTAYRNVTPIQILTHLDTRWCPLDVHAKKKFKQDYYTKWDGETHLTAFGKRLDDDQVRIERFGITISDDDKLQFYLEQMYASNTFDKKEMTEWENKPEAIKNDFEEAKLYFEGLVKDYETYEQNSGGTTGKHKYDSALQTREADQGDELREYIAKIATAAVAREEKQEELTANMRDSAAAKESEFKAMALQIKLLTDAVALLAKNSNNKENEPKNKRTGGATKEKEQYTKPRSMGNYCWTHGYHPAGANHSSATCTWKKEGHDITATWTNRKGGCVYWPNPIRVRVEDQAHGTYAGKVAPTN